MILSIRGTAEYDNVLNRTKPDKTVRIPFGENRFWKRIMIL